MFICIYRDIFVTLANKNKESFNLCNNWLVIKGYT